MTFTPEQLRQFAEAGGWIKIHANPDHPAFGCPPNSKQLRALPKFLNDLAACFEVLEYVTRNLVAHTPTWFLTKRENIDGIAEKTYRMEIGWNFIGFGNTKQEAIIAAVLAAKEQP